MITKLEIEQCFYKGDKGTVEKLYNKIFNEYKNLLWKVAFVILNNKEDSEDCIQEVFVSFLIRELGF